ncbi:scavenger receptor class F member 2-like [Saccostrea echinata]|uniref:scavenger receptor class F member 2-like n=1 Tax=Saccostrea echinata TaxID=191078 RepID=UPI002A837F4F|nr:scavenger receptor class F member 2-like [Saccostrea echinata]
MLLHILFKACLKGFHGTDCMFTCSPPTFGEKCLSTCHCPNESCHHVFGCKNSSAVCESGKFGNYCQYICRYPSYGDRCQQRCKCDEDHCNPSTGCQELDSTHRISSEAYLSMLATTETSTVFGSTDSTLKKTSDGIFLAMTAFLANFSIFAFHEKLLTQLVIS